MTHKIKKSRGRYPGTELNLIANNQKGGIGVALVYPNTYSVGISNLGFQTVYNILNKMEGTYCERAFLTGHDEPPSSKIRTLESNRLLTDFHVIAFSISFESDFLNLIAVVEKAGLPLQSAARGHPHPLVIAGGVACFMNPEPVAPFIDCFLIGEAEKLLPPFFLAFDPAAERETNLEHIVRTVPGVYVPLFYTPTHSSEGMYRGLVPRSDKIPAKVKKVSGQDVSSSPAHSYIISTNAAFKDTFLIEVGRGCPYGCRFCGAGYVYRPPRFRTLETLKKNVAKGKTVTDKIGFVGAAVSDHPEISALCRYSRELGCDVSFSSLRADSVTDSLLSSLRGSGIKTATIAPEAGTEKMRRVINKGIKEKTLLNLTSRLVCVGIPNIKLYFMVGLPGETEEDVHGIVDLCVKIKEAFLSASRKKKRIGLITVSVNPFIPKPFTPFQWAPVDSFRILKRKINTVRKGLKRVSNLRVQSNSIRNSLFQAVLSRGDRRVADILVATLKNNGNWKRALKNSCFDPAILDTGERSVDEVLPWDFIDHGINKRFLIKEYEKSKKGETTPPCQPESCIKCGVCKGI